MTFVMTVPHSCQGLLCSQGPAKELKVEKSGIIIKNNNFVSQIKVTSFHTHTQNLDFLVALKSSLLLYTAAKHRVHACYHGKLIHVLEYPSGRCW